MSTGSGGGERPGLGERLLAERKRRGLRQLDVARQIGVRRETIARIEVDHIASQRTQAKVRHWLEEEQKKAPGPAIPPGGAAAKAAAERAARNRERRAAAKRLGPEKLRTVARLAIRRQTERAFRRR